jgi:ubiquinone/menaquinone biosynthesis C-methylase UbiE
MSDPGLVGNVGRHVPSFSSALRPHPLDELREWGGPPLVRGKRVLDIGCGDGRLALGFAPLATRVDGIDPDPEAIAAAKRSARMAGIRNVRFVTGAAQHLPYPGAALTSSCSRGRFDELHERAWSMP